MFAITAFGLCAVGGVLLGDALTLRPQEAVRTASLAPPLVRDHVPPRMARLLLLQAASLVALLVMGAVTASSGPDRIGGAGRVRIAFGPGDYQQRRDRAWAITGAWGLLVSSQVLLVVLMLLIALTERACAGVLGAVTIVAICPLGLLSVFTFGWSLVTMVAPRAVDDEAADDGTFDDE